MVVLFLEICLLDGRYRENLSLADDFWLIGVEDGGEAALRELLLEGVLFFVDFDGLALEFHGNLNTVYND
jgi:hypothetical protein